MVNCAWGYVIQWSQSGPSQQARQVRGRAYHLSFRFEYIKIEYVRRAVGA
jgi:hypothetical protein